MANLRENFPNHDMCDYDVNLYPDANHGAGIFTYIETPFLWPSSVGKNIPAPWGTHLG